MMLKRDCTNLCLDTLFDETRPASPESIVFDSEFPESFSNMPSDDEYTQSFLDYWLSELRPPSPQIPESIGELLHGHSLPDETVRTDNRLMAHICDPFYEGNYVCDEFHFFEDAVNKQSESACNQNKFEDFTVSNEEPDSPAKSCHSQSIIPDSKPLQDSSLCHSRVHDLTETDSHPEMLMLPAETVETGPVAPSSDTNNQSCFVRRPPWTAKNLD